jgi:uncharacterized membrane protein
MSETEIPVSAEAEQLHRRLRRTADRKLQAVKARYAGERVLIEMVADALTRAAGSAPFLVFHVVWFALWVGWNSVPFWPFDPFPFGLLTMIVSLEAIGLSIFILMSQNREADIAELRAEVTLEINLRVEEEVTKSLQLLTGLYSRLHFPLAEDPELREMLKPLDKERIERELAEQIHHLKSRAEAAGRRPSS